MDVIKAILTALLDVVLIIVGLFLTVAIGYSLGIILTILPFVSGWLTATLPVTAAQIPAITAWLAVAGLFIEVTSKVANKGAD